MKPKKNPGIFSLLKPYKRSIWLLALLAVSASGLGLFIPKIISHAIDSFISQSYDSHILLFQFGGVAVAIFILTYFQNIMQTYTSERVARDLREKVAGKISRMSYAFVEETTQAKLLTNLTSDIDAIKIFVAQAISSIASSIIIIIGASILLFTINWKLALAVVMIIPIIGAMFFFVLKRVRALMMRAREVIDWLNKVINESILGSALIRVLNSQQPEYEKFFAANTDAKGVGLQILKNFASMIPLVVFVANMAVLTILAYGGHFVINQTMSLGDFAAFNSYVALLIFPILIIGMMSNHIAQATASYGRISEVLEAKEKNETGKLKNKIKGNVEVENVTHIYGEKSVLKNVSFSAKAGSKTAIIGPTAAGKTQLLYLLIGLTQPTEGSIKYDGHTIDTYDKEALHKQVGFVFQDSSIFNLTLRENIAFSDTVKDSDLDKALETAELTDFVNDLPDGLNTIVAERGSSLSGGQRQRMMLARALALNPKVLLLDDFTARVDNRTEQKILDNITKNYPDLTLISVTQKISSVEKYDQIVLLMEGEVIATGTHEKLLTTCPEYVQIYDSQRSTSHYE